MPRANQLVKRSTSYFCECPCGYSSICGSPKERELKHKLHNKRCEKRDDLQMGCNELVIDYVMKGDNSVLNSVIDKKRMFSPKN